MDELTIGDKVYVSSKRAAKITGYAKDYVGQLCREGRVEARLVGRNWYVLESSIKEHRFGENNEEKLTSSESVVPASPIESAWEVPRYIPEESKIVPELAPRPSPVQESHQVKPEMLADMQSAWGEWFQKQEKALPDASEMLLPVGEEPEDSTLVVSAQESVLPIEEEVSAIPVHRFASAETYSSTPMPEQEFVSIHRAHTAQAVQETSTRRFPASHRPDSQETQRKEIRIPKKQGGSSILIKALLISLTGLAVAVALAGSGFADRFADHEGIQGKVLDFLGGVSEYKSSN